MRKLSRVFTLAALAVAFGLPAALPGGLSRAADKESKDAGSAELDRRARVVQDIPAAYGLIDFARRPENRKAIALLTAVDMLAGVGHEHGKIADVEGAGKGKVPEFSDEMRALLKEAAGLPGGDSAAAKALADEVMEKVVADEKRPSWRGAAAGPFCARVIVEPTNSAADRPVKVMPLFMGGTGAWAFVTRLDSPGGPLEVRVASPDGREIYHDKGNTHTVCWRVPKGPDTKYRIEMRNHSGKDVPVAVYAN